MTTHADDIPRCTIDSKALAALIIELNIARRNYRSYPTGHPVITASLRKVVDIYAGLMTTCNEIVIGVARESFMVAGVSLEKSNQVYRDFAKALFERGIGTLELHAGLTAEELRNFTIILGLKREDIQQHGGIEQVWTKARIASLSIRPISYDLFRTTEETAVCAEQSAQGSLWERFAKALSQGESIGGDSSSVDEFDPLLLAEALNRQYAQDSSSFAESSTVRSISDVMRRNDIRASDSKQSDLPYQQLAAFVSHLNPELQRQFLSSSIESSSSGIHPHVEKLMSALSSEMILSTLDDVNANRLRIPSVIMGLLNRLSSHAEPLQQGADDELNTHAETFRDQDELGSRMKTLFREHVSEEFVPDVYQKKLDKIMTADQVPLLLREEMSELQETFNPKQIESRISEVILQLVMIDSTSDDTDSLVHNLNALSAYFLETGDYDQLIKIMAGSRDERLPANVRHEIQEYFAQRSFVEEALSGLHVWGKSRFDQIRKVLDDIGESCVEPILDALAAENSMSLRRFMIDRLLELGPLARQAITSRLSDSRWYYLRNLIIILRTMNDASVIEQLKPLSLHSDARVRLEAIRTLLHFRDPSVELKILSDMDSSDHGVRLEATHLAEKSHSPEISRKLLSIVRRSGLSSSEYELKSAAVHSLGQLGQPNVLPEFATILSSRNLLHPVLLSRLKIDIVRSLEHYPATSSRPILERLTNGKDEVANQAFETLKSMTAKRI